MFTGIIEEVGLMHNISTEKSNSHQFRIQTSVEFIQGVSIGDSVAVNGVCLTAYDIQEDSFQVDVSNETSRCTNISNTISNHQVNLERSVTPSTRLGGHMVSGHVDGLGTVVEREDHESETVLWVKVPADLLKYIAVKGSICINGISLTVNKTLNETFCVTIIPHTLQNTTLNSVNSQDSVNIEVDLVARYLEKLSQPVTS